MDQQRTVVLVTGGNKGIGKEIVRQMCGPDRIVYLGARDADRAEETLNSLGRPPGELRRLHIDVTDDHSIAEAATQIEANVESWMSSSITPTSAGSLRRRPKRHAA